jgi:hypothetical protein
MASIKRPRKPALDKSQKRLRRTRIYEKSYRSLDKKQKRIRRDSLKVLRDARRNPTKSLTQIIREHNKTAEKKIALKTVLNNTAAFTKVNNRWIANKTDAISRSMLMAENGKSVSVETRNSEEASKIGRYEAAVKHYLNTGSLERLRVFDGMTVTDSDGVEHKFETEIEKVKDAHAIARASDHPQVYVK